MSGPDPKSCRRRRHLIPFKALLCAALIGLAFGVCHFLGMREHVSALLRAAADGRTSVAAAKGGLYVLLYFSVVLLVPIILLGAGIYVVLALVFRGRRRRADASDQPQQG